MSIIGNGHNRRAKAGKGIMRKAFVMLLSVLIITVFGLSWAFADTAPQDELKSAGDQISVMANDDAAIGEAEEEDMEGDEDLDDEELDEEEEDLDDEELDEEEEDLDDEELDEEDEDLDGEELDEEDEDLDDEELDEEEEDLDDEELDEEDEDLDDEELDEEDEDLDDEELDEEDEDWDDEDFDDEDEDWDDENFDDEDEDWDDEDFDDEDEDWDDEVWEDGDWDGEYMEGGYELMTEKSLITTGVELEPTSADSSVTDISVTTQVPKTGDAGLGIYPLMLLGALAAAVPLFRKNKNNN